MKAEGWFLSELRLVAPQGVYPYYFSRYKKWFIVKDVPYRVMGITDYDPLTGKNFSVEMIVEDERQHPLPLDRMTLRAIRLFYSWPYKKKPFSYWWKVARQQERRREKEAANEWELRRKDAGKDANHMMTKLTINLPGKEIQNRADIVGIE